MASVAAALAGHCHYVSADARPVDDAGIARGADGAGLGVDSAAANAVISIPPCRFALRAGAADKKIGGPVSRPAQFLLGNMITSARRDKRSRQRASAGQAGQDRSSWCRERRAADFPDTGTSSQPTR